MGFDYFFKTLLCREAINEFEQPPLSSLSIKTLSHREISDTLLESFRKRRKVDF